MLVSCEKHTASQTKLLGLMDAFVARVASTEGVCIGHGQCIEHHGAGEASLPLLDTLGRFRHPPGGGCLVELLRQQAPSWLSHLPALVAAAGYDTL
jgi:hypothetical protein